MLLIAAILSLWVDPVLSQSSGEEEIETLEVIEIPGTAVNLEKRQVVFAKPTMHDGLPYSTLDVLRIPAKFSVIHQFDPPTVALDPIGKERGIMSKPKPIKIERPPYPRIAKEQGWQGTVKLTLTIEADGKVSSANIHTSSGVPILDSIALEATREWLFEPQKDGEFPVAAKVNVPVKFNLHDKK